ncbi:MAG TPA: hypothetical protein V6C85_12785 [Allocoleopsis sp.]
MLPAFYPQTDAVSIVKAVRSDRIEPLGTISCSARSFFWAK